MLDLVDLASAPARVRSRTVLDAAGGYAWMRDGRPRWELSLQASNLSNRRALYNFQSAFVGTRVVSPASVGVKVRW